MKVPKTSQNFWTKSSINTALSVPLACFLLHTLLVCGAIWLLGDNYLLAPGGFVNPLLTQQHSWADSLIRWDAHWYTYVAQTGYNEMSIVFFPLLIFLIKALAPFCQNDYALTGLLICNFFCLVSFIVLYKLLQLDFGKNICDKALLSYALMPTSYYLNSVYTEPLFLTCALSGMYYAKQRNWLPAGGLMALASLTRNLGIFLIFPLLMEIGSTYQWQLKRMLSNSSWASLLLPPAALGCYILYNYFLLGNPLAFVDAQQAWGRMFSLPWNNIINSFLLLSQNTSLAMVMDLLMLLFTLSGMLLLTFCRQYAIPKSYLLLGWFWLFIPLCSTTSWLPLYSMSRFVLIIFPLYLWLAQLPLRLFVIFLIVSSVGLVTLSILFSNWYWIS